MRNGPQHCLRINALIPRQKVTAWKMWTHAKMRFAKWGARIWREGEAGGGAWGPFDKLFMSRHKRLSRLPRDFLPAYRPPPLGPCEKRLIPKLTIKPSASLTSLTCFVPHQITKGEYIFNILWNKNLPFNFVLSEQWFHRQCSESWLLSASPSFMYFPHPPTFSLFSNLKGKKSRFRQLANFLLSQNRD